MSSKDLPLLIENSNSPNYYYIINNDIKDYVVIDGGNANTTAQAVLKFCKNVYWKKNENLMVVTRNKNDSPPNNQSIKTALHWKDVSGYVLQLYNQLSIRHNKKQNTTEIKPTIVLPFIHDESSTKKDLQDFVNKQREEEQKQKILELENMATQISLEMDKKENNSKSILKGKSNSPKKNKKVTMQTPPKSTKKSKEELNEESEKEESEKEEFEEEEESEEEEEFEEEGFEEKEESEEEESEEEESEEEEPPKSKIVPKNNKQVLTIVNKKQPQKTGNRIPIMPKKTSK